MTKVFSFCIYGNQKKYTEGLIENIELILQNFPDFEVWIIGGNDVPEEYVNKYTSYKNVKYFQKNFTGYELRVSRFYFLDDDEVEILFSRDADPRIEERDSWCINQFLKSEHHLHIIRDHYHHRRLMMGGMWGIKKTKNLSLENNYKVWRDKNNDKVGLYYSDQDFIDEYIYPLYQGDMLIHSNLIGFKGETVSPIKIEMKDDKDFVGNVYEYDSSGKKYLSFSWKGYDYTELCKWLFSQGQMELFHNSRRSRTFK